jgi:E3 ubiquitin-protein ligase HERC2
MSNNELYFRALPHLDKKWSKANLTSALHNPEDLAIFWNNLLQDDELSTIRYKSIINSAGHLAYLKGNDKFYCGAATLTCSCCKGVCSEKSACSCQACQKLESEEAGKKFQHAQFQQDTDEKLLSSELVFESWLWSPIPSNEQKTACIKSLLAEQHEICLQSAASCLSAVQLKQLMLVYRRYFIALARCKDQDLAEAKQVQVESAAAVETKAKQLQTVAEKPLKDYEKATMGLARVGTRAALNFSFAFLRRAWKSGEDTELCSELLMEALDALQTLPEGSLFDTSQISSIWMEVVEKSIKFLRQVVGDAMGRVPKPDRHIALSLLLELGTQKGTLAGSLEGILLLLTLWEKDAESVDNRAPLQTTGAPLVPILRRYEKISSNYVYNQAQSDRSLPSSPTESFLRFLSLPDDDTARVDLKQAAVIIISHLDRLAKPHLPIGNYSSRLQQHKSTQQIFTLGWSSLSPEVYGFTAEAITGAGVPGMLPKYSASTIELEGGHIVGQVVSSETAILLLTTQGSVFVINHSPWSAGGAATNLQPKMLEFSGDGVTVVQVAAHCEGKHFLALTDDGEVYSWGLGEGGRLGHGDHTTKEQPTKIEALTDKSICRVFCGATYSAAISSSGECYTWGRGSYGRLGHGTSDDKLAPTQIQALKSHRVVDVALGSGDSHSLCATATGHVFAWGDGDFGKLGNGSSNGAQIPQQIEGLEKIVNVYSGSQFSVALSSDGVVYSWGKGHGGRLGHGSFDHVSVPKVVQALEGKQICQISVGSAHSLALTTGGELYGWGRNDYHQICPVTVNRDPIISVPILTTPPSLRIAGVTCGLALSISWCNSSSLGISTKMPFVVDLSEHSFRLLDQLFCMVCGAQTDAQRHLPNQEAECIVVACLNLLRLQLHAIIANNLSARQVGLCEGSRLLASLKSRVLSLAGGPTVLKTMQEAAQWTLQVGWSVLLPTASERAQTLTALLPAGHEGSANTTTNNCTSGYRFMTDLLVGSLMAEGGLQTALNQAINAEPQDVTSEHHLPLLHLLKQLLR